MHQIAYSAYRCNSRVPLSHFFPATESFCAFTLVLYSFLVYSVNICLIQLLAYRM